MEDDFDISTDHVDFFAQPYLFEPEYSDQELREMEEASAAAARLQASERQRSHQKWWCSCSKCCEMTTEVESICCHEWNIAMPQLQDADEDIAESVPSHTCLTEDPDFSPLLSRSVLHVVFSLPRINWRRRPRPEGPNNTLSIE